jgi:dipeptidyl aminopeptidase/acylaminoacyl peptidase
MRRLFASQASLTILTFLVAGMGWAPVEQRAQSGAPAAGAAARKEAKWTPEDMVAAERAGQFRISPDSQWVVWVKFVPDTDKDEMVSNLYLSSLTEKKETQLTRGPNKDERPKWSLDGHLVAFLSDRPLPKPPSKESAPPGELSKTQLWLINPFGGEPWPLTRSERGVKDFAWLDANTILIAAEEDPSLYERNLKEKKDDARAVDDAAHTPPVRLFKVNAKTQEIARLTDNNDWIDSLALSPDGKKALTIHARSLSYEFDQKIKPVTFLYDVATGKGKQLFTDGKILPFQVRWTLDSAGFYAVSPYSTHPLYRTAVVNQLYYYDLARDKAVKVDLEWENELGLETGGAYGITRDGFIALLAAGSRLKPARYTREGDNWKRAWLEGEHANNIFDLEVGKDGQTVVYNTSTASRPEQWFRARLQGATLAGPTPLTELNTQFQHKTAAKSEVVRWRGSLDEEVEGILYYPQNYEPGKKYSLVVMIHGGPLGADMDGWDQEWAYPINLYTQRGAFVLRPNYHGSGNYGLKWAESIGGGKYYDLEVPDIEKGVDSLIARGVVDPDRLGVLGWSNGAILTTAVTLNSTRYKAASAGAGDVEWISDWGNVDFGASFDNYYFGKSPLEDPELYIRKSPLFRMKNLRTPTLIFFGTEDRNVPPSQGWTHFRTLQQLEQTPVRFILFPGEPHGPRKLSHQRRKVEEELAWFDKYLFKSADEKNEAFREDSPLAEQLKRQKIKKVGLQYGVQVKSVLVPEMVPYQGLELGRFEVTRAQYAAFDKNYQFDPGTENFPANGITFESAQAYGAWLSKLTGETYRLGTEAELEPIYKTAKGSENTLDYWAGYKPNPDDAARLQARIKGLKGAAPLLKEVGSFRGVGEDDWVFDLGGNVAEWCAGKDGKGKQLGGSADRPADPKTPGALADPAYVGFRVVKGAPTK